ncbi:hypothetical protein [Sinorhizobium fredii]|uniref:hypothetical protein n=1 Tax=Rhizobium fredii TaxID=380 RepID=UPI00129725DE|nr:hypothetical protein [Sinorhizobium fredii]MQW94079.1 hypothetical protein [Sinorhizobium fredii]
MPVKMMKKSATATQSTQVKDKGTVVSEDVEEEKVELPGELDKTAEGPWCEVGVDASYTHNLGNYQSAKVGVTLKIPCLHGEINDVFDFAKSWVDEKMQGLIDELQSDPPKE